MKNLFLAFAILVSSYTYSQDVIENIFQKYRGKDGFTSIIISKDLFEIAAAFDDDNDLDALNGKISDLKILVAEDKSINNQAEFTEEVRSFISKGSYLNIMEVIDGKDKVNFYAKKDGDKIIHLVMLALSKDDEVLLSIKGDFTTKDLVKLGKNSEHHSGLDNLKKLEKIDQ